MPRLKKAIDGVLGATISKGFFDGLIGGKDLWLAGRVVAFLARRWRRGRKPRILAEVLKPGESLLVTHISKEDRPKRTRA